MNSYTEGPLHVADPHYIIFDEGGTVVADTFSGVRPSEEDTANAHRLVAAWNACAGIPTEALTPGVVGELITTLNTLVTEARYLGTPAHHEFPATLREAQALLERIPEEVTR